jgi:HSP20 family protein
MAVTTRRTEKARQTPQRSEPFADLEQIARLMESVWAPVVGNLGSRVWIPRADVEETEDAWIVEAELPGVDRKDVNVELHGSELVITGEIKEKERKGILRRRTRRTGEFEYRITLPAPADEEHVDADLHEGVLTVRVPKTEQSRRRRIEVQAG